MGGGWFWGQIGKEKWRLTSNTCSSSSSLKTVPVNWLGFRACQFNSGMRNLVWMAFLLLPIERETERETERQRERERELYQKRSIEIRGGKLR